MSTAHLHRRVCYCPASAPANASAVDALSSSASESRHRQLGTILYRGPVPPAKGEWYGIEWDDASRGRHSGTYDKTGVQYFQTRVEGAGSFLRTDVKGLDVVGKCFSDAVAERYLEDETETGARPSAPSSDEATALGSVTGPDRVSKVERHATLSNFDIEVVLNDRVTNRFKDLGRLREVGLEWEGVSRAARSAEKDGYESAQQRELQQFGQQMRSLEGLNLSFSLLPTVEEVDDIVNVLPKLSCLAINSNCFHRIEKPLTLPGFERLVRLELNSTLMTWPELRRVAPSLPNLVDLEFGFNRLRGLTLEHAKEGSMHAIQEQQLLPKLERLNLASNELESWDDLIEELANLPRLTELVLDNNRLRDLAYPAKGLSQQSATTSPRFGDASSDTRSLRHLRHLRQLSLRQNMLSSWKTSIEALATSSAAAFPSLVDLRVANNPLFDTASRPSESGDRNSTPDFGLPAADEATALRREADTRLLVIARLPQLVELERSPVHASERVDAERFWLGRLAQGHERLEDLSDWARERVRTLEKEHPDLVVRRSDPGSEGQGQAAARTIKSRMIRLAIKISPDDFPKLSSAAPVELSVLPSLRTLILRTQIARSLGVPIPKTKYRLVARLPPAEGGSEEIEVEIPPNEEGKEVSWWGLQDGDTVEVVAV